MTTGILAFRHGGAAAVGIVGLARMLPAALLAPIAAVLADRYRRERVLVAVGAVRAGALGAAALLVAQSRSPVPAYVLIAIATLAHTLYRPAHSALLPSICTTATELTNANVVRGLLDSLSALLGPLLVGVLISPLGVSGVLAVWAAVALWSGWLIGRVQYESPPRLADAAAAHLVRETLDGLVVTARSAELRLLTTLGVVQTVTRGCFTVFSVVVAIQVLGLGESGVGVLTAGFGAGAVLGSLAVSMFSSGISSFGRRLALGVALWGIPFIALAGTTHEWLAILLLAVVGVANAVVDVSYFTLLQLLVPDELMGRVFAIDESLLTIGVAVGAIATPGLIALLGIRGALVAAGLLAPLVAALAWSRLRRLDARMDTADDAVRLLQRVAMLAPLPLATITQLAAKAVTGVFPAGEVIVREGSTGEEFFVIVHGQGTVSVDGSYVRTLGPADCFGEIAALTESVRTATVTAETDLESLQFTRTHFVRAITGYASSHDAASTLLRERLAHASSSAVKAEVDHESDRVAPGERESTL